MTLLYDDLLGAGSAIYFYDLQSAPSLGSNPAVSAVGTARYQSPVTITGTNFGASAGQVTIGGVVQPILSWSATSVVVSAVARGTLKYGTQPLVVRDSSSVASSPFNISLLPQTSWNYVNMVAPLATAGQRLAATPDLTNSDQVAYGNVLPGGSVTVASDGSFTATALAGAFDFEVNDGTDWGAGATVTLGAVAIFNGVLTSRAATLTGAYLSGAAKQFAGALRAASATISGNFLGFRGRTASGVLRAGLAVVQGVFAATGAVVNPNPNPTPAPGTGTVASKVQVVNLGLVKLGAGLINSFQDDSKAARLASVLFDRLADQEMARHYWGFAIARIALPEAVSNEPKGPYMFAYGKPADWLSTMLVGTEADYVSLADAEWSHEGNYILTNLAPPCPLMYLRRISDVTKWDALFIEALACRIGEELADALTNSSTKWQKCNTQYRAAIAEARRVNAIQDPPRTLAADSWLASRY